MPIIDCYQFQCEQCCKVEHSAHTDILPVPPVGWQIIDITEYIPPHSEDTSAGKVKLGPVRRVTRKVVCGNCKLVAV